MVAKQVNLTVIYDLVSDPRPLAPTPPTHPPFPLTELPLLSHRAKGNLQRHR